jgi:hypothetical protein
MRRGFQRIVRKTVSKRRRGRFRLNSEVPAQLWPGQRPVVNHLAADQPVAAGIRQDIIDRSDGVPLFVEEVTKAVLEANDQIDPGQIINVSPSRFEVPATLQASLMARLDRTVGGCGSSVGARTSIGAQPSCCRRPAISAGRPTSSDLCQGLGMSQPQGARHRACR